MKRFQPLRNIIAKRSPLRTNSIYFKKNFSTLDYQVSKSIKSPVYELMHSKTLAEMQTKTAEVYQSKNFLGTKNGSSFEWITFKEFDQQVATFRNVLKSLGMVQGDTVAIISNNRVEWAVSAYGTMGIGGQFVPMYESQLETDWQYIITDSDAKLIVVANERIYETIQKYIGTVGKVQRVICLDCPTVPKEVSFKHLMEANQSSIDNFTPINSNIDYDTISTIIYTSGTSGKPKGVQLSHGNMIAQLTGSNPVNIEMLSNTKLLGYLPWAHVFGMVLDLHSSLCLGSSLAIISTREHILEGMQIIQPSAILTVPMMFNRIYDGVMKTVNQSSSIKKWLFHTALHYARIRNHKLEYGQPVSALEEMQFKLADSLVLKGIRNKIGKNMQ